MPRLIQREITENTPTLFDVTISTSHIVSMYWRAIRLVDGIIILPKAEFGRGGSNSCLDCCTEVSLNCDSFKRNRTFFGVLRPPRLSVFPLKIREMIF